MCLKAAHANLVTKKREKTMQEAVTSEVQQEKSLLYLDRDLEFWSSAQACLLVFLLLHNTAGVLMLGFFSTPFGIYVWLPDMLVFAPLCLLCIRAKYFTMPSYAQQSSFYNICIGTSSIKEYIRILFLASIAYWAVLWSAHSLTKPLPTCQVHDKMNEMDKMACSWAKNLAIFLLHAIPGPLVLLLSTYNVMPISRGALFKKGALLFHKWIGRIHNVILLVAAVGALLLALVSATFDWIKIGFYVLLALWVPSMLLGWFFIYFKRNIKQHSRWMIRNYACTAGAIVLRLANLVTLGNTPYFVMVYVALVHVPFVELYLQISDDCDRKWVMDTVKCVFSCRKRSEYNNLEQQLA